MIRILNPHRELKTERAPLIRSTDTKLGYGVLIHIQGVCLGCVVVLCVWGVGFCWVLVVCVSGLCFTGLGLLVYGCWGLRGV